MQIYSLKDEIQNDNSSRSDTLVITDLKQGVKNPNRVSVFVNSKFSFSLDLAQIVDFGIKVGREIDESELDEYKNASLFGKLYQRTLEWVLIRPRSKKETVEYLNKKIFEKKLNKEYVDIIIEKLIDKNYLDDNKFAKWYVENRFVKKGVSKKRLDMELRKKGIEKDIIEEVLSERSDEDEIKKMILRKRSKYDDEKLMMYLCRQGFPYDLVRKLVEESD